MKRIYFKMLWRAVQLQSGLLAAVLISDLALAQPVEGQWTTVQRSSARFPNSSLTEFVCRET